VARYRQRISGPLLDRIDLCVSIDVPSVEELCTTNPTQRGPTHTQWRARVERALERMRARRQLARNGDLCHAQLDAIVPLSGEARALISRAAQARGLSARGVQSLRRVARTLADLDDEEAIAPKHFAQALGLRAPIS
jgi:magnesium chelatase family protein